MSQSMLGSWIKNDILREDATLLLECQSKFAYISLYA